MPLHDPLLSAATKKQNRGRGPPSASSHSFPGSAARAAALKYGLYPQLLAGERRLMTRINMKKSFNFGMCPSKLPAEKRTNAPEKAFECGKRMIPSTNPHARPLKGLHKGPFFSRMMFGAGHFSQSQCWCFRDKMRWCFVFWPQPLHDTS
jgi:hypothetical protein